MNRRIFITLIFLIGLLFAQPVAADIGSSQNPQSGTIGLVGSIPSNPPTQAATIAVPTNGQVFTSIPITVSGLCQSGLLVKIFSNNIFVGSVTCTNGSYSLKIDLFSGRNDLVARVYDSFDQAGPDSNVVTVTFNDAQFAQFGTHVSLTSSYARIGVNPGSTLTWPIILSGGTGPYAISVDWGDGNSSLESVSFAGTFNIDHIYNQSGVYTIVVKATDSNNTSAYLQLVGVANGKISGSINGTGGSITYKTIIFWPLLLIMIPVLILAFWLGRRHELYTIRQTIESSREEV